MSPDPLDTLELLHGQQDAVLPVRLTQQVYVGLMTQAIYRLQTGLPLRFWRSA